MNIKKIQSIFRVPNDHCKNIYTLWYKFESSSYKKSVFDSRTETKKQT